jgi:hypothetical protein
MIGPQSPPLQVFISAQSMLAVDVPSQRLPSVAAVQTNHMLLADGSSYRHSRSTNFLGVNGLSKLAERLMYGSDDLRKLVRAHFVLPYVAPDYFRGENWINPFNVHDIGLMISLLPSYITRKESVKRGFGQFTARTTPSLLLWG